MATIMIVEDELLEQDFLRELLLDELSPQDTIITCTTGSQAIQDAQQYRPNIILIDIQLPEMDGLQALQEIRRFLPNALVLIISACSDFSYAQKAIRLGVLEYLLKPVRPDEFRQAFRRILTGLTPFPPPLIDAVERECTIPQTSAYTDVIEKSIQYIKKNFKQKISLKDVSANIYMNPQYVSRIFKKEVGMSCIDYINKLKIEYACKLLETTDKTAYYIAIDCGFSDQSYFNRVFVNQMGLTPKAFRRQYRCGKEEDTKQELYP